MDAKVATRGKQILWIAVLAGAVCGYLLAHTGWAFLYAWVAFGTALPFILCILGESRLPVTVGANLVMIATVSLVTWRSGYELYRYTGSVELYAMAFRWAGSVAMAVFVTVAFRWARDRVAA